MRLFKAWYKYCDSKEDVMVMWANNEQEVKDAIANIQSKRECFTDWLFHDNSLDELLEDIKDVRVFSALQEGKQAFANEVFRLIDLKEWSIEELFVSKYAEIFVCYPQDIQEGSDVEVVPVHSGVFDVEDYVWTELARRLSRDPLFKEYVSDFVVNAGLNETFYMIDGLYAFSELLEFEPNFHIQAKFHLNLKEANKYIEQKWEENIREFFKDEPGYADEYIEHVKHPTEDYEFETDFYEYCAKKVILTDKSYLDYEIVKVEAIL